MAKQIEATRGTYGHPHSDVVDWRLNQLKDAMPRNASVRNCEASTYLVKVTGLSHLEVMRLAEFLKSEGIR
jgi:hypothetical protein